MSFNVSMVEENQYLVNSTVSFLLSETQQQALTHGVKLHADIDFALGKHRSWWWNSLKLISRISYQLEYHALSKHYLLKRLDSDEHWSFSNLPSALKQMGAIREYELPTFDADINDKRHYLYMAAEVDVETRSLPLKIQAYFKDSKYHAESDGVLWALP